MSSPKKLYTKRAFRTNELKIVPSTGLDNIKLDVKVQFTNLPTSICVYLDDDAEAIDLHFVLSGPPTSNVNDPTKWEEKIAFEPFWWMATTNDERLATVSKQIVWKDGVAFSTFVNHKELSENDEILYYIPKKETAPNVSIEQRARAEQDRCVLPKMRRKRFKQAP